jgi:hypothetical protein
MTRTTEIHAFCHEHGACSDAVKWLTKSKITTLKQTWEKCQRGEWMIWTLRKAGKMDKPMAVKIAVACAQRVLTIYEKKNPGKLAPRQAIEAALAWLENQTEENVEKARIAAADAAYAAAYAAAAAAYDAAYAAAAAAYDAAYAAAYAYDAAYAAAADAAAAAYAAVDAAAGKFKERKAQAVMLRKMLGNPFSKVKP